MKAIREQRKLKCADQAFFMVLMKMLFASVMADKVFVVMFGFNCGGEQEDEQQQERTDMFG